MKLGIHLPQIGGSAEDIARVARRADETGWNSIWVSEHILVPESGGRIQKLEIMDPIPTLAYVAAITRRVRLATSVMVLPYRNAIVLGKELATIDRLCGGRLIVGAASGWLEEEFAALDAPYERRGAYTDEAIRLWREVWSRPTPEFAGEFFKLSGMRFGPRPAAENIPVWVGGTSKRAVRRAVELGDGWHGTRMKPEEVAQRVEWIKEIAERNRRPLDRFAITHRVYVGFAERWTETGGYVQGILAPPEELAEYLSRYAPLGVQELLIAPLGGDPSLEKFLDRFDAEVRPRVA